MTVSSSPIGGITANALCNKAHRAQYQETRIPRSKRLMVQGVGEKAAYCDEEYQIPIAVKFQDQKATQENYRTHVMDGCGVNLPAIMGSASMEEKDVVIIMRKGKQQIVFPGPGGYQIEWSPGTKILPAINSPSGHLVVECDLYDQLSKQPSEEITLWTDHKNPQQPTSPQQ